MLKGFRRYFSSDVLESLEEFKRGVHLVETNKLAMAELEFKRCLEILDSSKLQYPYHRVLFKLAHVYKLQHKHQHTEKTLQQIIENHQGQDELLLNSYLNLMKQYLDTDLDKCIQLGSSLSEFPLPEELNSLLGTAYLLKGQNFSEAKNYLKRSSTGFALNNLACAQWWESLGEQEQVMPNLLKAIKVFENKQETYEVNLENPDLENPLTGVCLTNVGEFLSDNSREEVWNS